MTLRIEILGVLRGHEVCTYGVMHPGMRRAGHPHAVVVVRPDDADVAVRALQTHLGGERVASAGEGVIHVWR